MTDSARLAAISQANEILRVQHIEMSQDLESISGAVLKLVKELRTAAQHADTSPARAAVYTEAADKLVDILRTSGNSQ